MAWSAQDLGVEWGRRCNVGKSGVVLQWQTLLVEYVTTGWMDHDMMFNTMGIGKGSNSSKIIGKGVP